MATKTVILRVSDLSGEELGDAGSTITFSLGSDQYLIDLSDAEVGAFYDVLAPYTQAATKVGGRGVRKGGTAKASSDVDTKAVRKWAEANGIEVSARGRIGADVIKKFKAAGN